MTLPATESRCYGSRRSATGFERCTRRGHCRMGSELSMADGSITVEVSTRDAQAEMERLRAENVTLKRDLEYARGGLTRGRTRMREDLERLTRELREAAARAEAAEVDAVRMREPLKRLWPLIERGTRGFVFTAERAGEVAADMNALRAAIDAARRST